MHENKLLMNFLLGSQLSALHKTCKLSCMQHYECLQVFMRYNPLLHTKLELSNLGRPTALEGQGGYEGSGLSIMYVEPTCER